MRKYYKYYKVVRVDKEYGTLSSAIMYGWQAMAYEENIWSHDPMGLGIFLYKNLSHAISFAKSFKCVYHNGKECDRREVWEVEATAITYTPVAMVKKFNKIDPDKMTTSLVRLDVKDKRDRDLLDTWALAKHVKLLECVWR